MREFITIVEAAAPSPTTPAEERARFYDSEDAFIRSLDSAYLDILYRGHFDGTVGNDVFMTDYIGHALSYADDEIANVDAFEYDPGTVMHFSDARFEQFRRHYARMDEDEFAEVYRQAVHGHRFFNDSMISAVSALITGDEPFDEVSMDHERMDPLVPLLQQYARSAGANIIAFLGGDYNGDGQMEYVVHDISQLRDLRQVYRAAHSQN